MSQNAIVLSVVEARVLGALVEKEVTTPEYYPLSLNALVNACNQRSNREPVMNLDEDEVRQALHGLRDKELAGEARAEGRVTRYEHHLGEVFNFTRAETALMTVLLLRGAQTPGELRGRTERLFSFDEISDVLASLQKLAERDPALVALLPRQPGARESRYAQLLSGPVESVAAQVGSDFAGNTAIAPAIAPEAAAAYEERIAQLEATVAELRQQFDGLQQKIDSLFG